MSTEPASAAPPSRREAARARTATAVTEAAAALLVETGSWEAVTIRGVGAKAGMSTGAVFNNFAGKDELLVAVLAASPEARAARWVEIRRQLVTVLDAMGAKAEAASMALGTLTLQMNRAAAE